MEWSIAKLRKIAGHWGDYGTYVCKVGTHPSGRCLIRTKRKFTAGDRIHFKEESELAGVRVGTTPKWETGIVTDVRDNIIFIERH
jgi:hypothetical protein